MNRTAALYALTSAALFGVSTPAAKALLGSVDPIVLAGLLYCGAGVGVSLLRRLMQLRVLKIDSPELAQFAAQLPVGKIYASGHGFVPQARTAIYDRLVQFADPAPAPGLPATWDLIDVGHMVLAREEGVDEGWWEAIVIAKDGDMLTLRFRDYPKQAPAVRHRAALVLLKPTAA